MGSKRMRRWDGTVRPVDDGRWKICSGRLPNFRRRCAPMISQRLGWLASHHQVETAGPSPSYCACVRVSMYFMPVWGPFSIRWSRFFRLDSVPVPSWISFSDTFFFFIVLRCAWTTIRHQNQILAKSSLVFSTRLSSSFVFNFFPCVTAFRRFSNNDASSELNPFQKSVPFFTSFPSGSSASAATRCCIGLKKTDYLSNSDDFSLFFLWDFVTSKNLSVRRQWVKTSCSFDGTAAAIDYWSPDLNSPDILGLQQLKLMSKGGGERNRERGGGGRGVGVWIEKELRRGRNEYNGGGCVGRREIPASIRRTRRHYPRIGPSRNERGREPVE